jgi:hypothetical protein
VSLGLAYLTWPIPTPIPRFTDGIALLRTWQAGRCAACGERYHHLVVDHDHGTGLVRGLLCPGCNTSEGFGGSFFQPYRDRSPADLLGIVELHKGLRFGPPRARDDPRWSYGIRPSGKTTQPRTSYDPP